MNAATLVLVAVIVCVHGTTGTAVSMGTYGSADCSGGQLNNVTAVLGACTSVTDLNSGTDLCATWWVLRTIGTAKVTFDYYSDQKCAAYGGRLEVDATGSESSVTGICAARTDFPGVNAACIAGGESINVALLPNDQSNCLTQVHGCIPEPSGSAGAQMTPTWLMAWAFIVVVAGVL